MYEKTNEQAYNLLPKQKKKGTSKQEQKHVFWKNNQQTLALKYCKEGETKTYTCKSYLFWMPKMTYQAMGKASAFSPLVITERLLLFPLSSLCFGLLCLSRFSPLFCLSFLFFSFLFYRLSLFFFSALNPFFFLSHFSEGFLVSKKSLLSFSLFCLYLFFFSFSFSPLFLLFSQGQ